MSIGGGITGIRGGVGTPEPTDWTPPGDWPDIKAIFHTDVPPPGYQKLGIVLFSDVVRTVNLSSFGGSYWKTFDGYTGPSKTYTPNTSLMTPSTEGYRVGWVILYQSGGRNVHLSYNNVIRGAVWIYIDDAHILTLNCSSSNPINGCLQLKCFETTASTTSVSGYSGSTFAGLSQLEKIVLPEGLTNTGYGLANGCAKLWVVKLPSTLTIFGASAFENCISLKTVDLGPIAVIPFYLLRGCVALKQIAMSASMVSVALNAFSNTGMDKLVFSGTATYTGTLELSATKEVVFEGAPTFDSATPFATGFGVLNGGFPIGWIPANGISLAAFRSLAPDNLVKFFERLGDNTGRPVKTLTVPTAIWAQLTTEEKAIAPGKNYIVQIG